MELRRFARGFVWGVVATVVMSVLMFLGRITGTSPIPKPIPVAIVAAWAVFLPAWLALLSGFAAHLVYGGFWAGYVTLLAKRVTVWHGLALGVVLWVVMGWIFLPFIGWGLWGSAVDPNIAWATLILHLVYGLVYGVFVDRGTSRAPATAEAGATS